jgi:hypothetical protein
MIKVPLYFLPNSTGIPPLLLDPKIVTREERRRGGEETEHNTASMSDKSTHSLMGTGVLRMTPKIHATTRRHRL